MAKLKPAFLLILFLARLFSSLRPNAQGATESLWFSEAQFSVVRFTSLPLRSAHALS